MNYIAIIFAEIVLIPVGLILAIFLMQRLGIDID